MDLTRAKTALILAFLVLNMYLGYQLWYSSDHYISPLTVTTGEVEQILAQVEEYNYDLIVPLPRQSFTMSLLSVQAKDLDEEGLVDSLFPEEPPLKHVQGQETIYSLNDKTLIFPGRGRAVYRKQPLAEPESRDAQDLQHRGEEFLQGKGLLPDDAVFGGIYPGAGGMKRVVFYQSYEGISLYTSFIDLQFQEDQVMGFDLYWLEPLEFSGENRHVLPATQALLRFLEVVGPAPSSEEIVDLSLGYFSRDYDAQKWDVVPVWRIASRSGSVVYINAFSGEEEES